MINEEMIYEYLAINSADLGDSEVNIYCFLSSRSGVQISFGAGSSDTRIGGLVNYLFHFSNTYLIILDFSDFTYKCCTQRKYPNLLSFTFSHKLTLECKVLKEWKRSTLGTSINKVGNSVGVVTAVC